jgi:hypothetical protein
MWLKMFFSHFFERLMLPFLSKVVKLEGCLSEVKNGASWGWKDLK